MNVFDKPIAENHLQQLLKQYKISVRKWRPTSSGCANWRKKEIEIPRPTNPDRFGVCMHEVKHVIDGNRGKRYEQEFYCDQFALEQMQLLNMGGTDEWIRRMNWHTLSRLAMAVNRGLNIRTINKEVKEFFSAVDFEKWIGKKVFVRSSKTEPEGYTIELTAALNKNEIEMLLNRKGLMLEKSEYDDSTYGHWIVKANGERFGKEFTNLCAIVIYYKLVL